MIILLAKITLILSLLGIIGILSKRILQDISLRKLFESALPLYKRVGDLFQGLLGRQRILCQRAFSWLKGKILTVRKWGFQWPKAFFVSPQPKKRQYFQRLLQSLELSKPEKKKAVPLRVVKPLIHKASGSELQKREILLKKEKALLHAIARNPKEIRLYKSLGMLYLELGERVDAKNCFEQALKLGSQDLEVKEALRKIERERDGTPR